MAKERYDHRAIEHAVQQKWAELDLYTTDLTNTEKDPYYLLVEFPYPSGDLHIGHWYAFAVTDIYARYMRLKGKNVLFPMGFDAFGLPAENAAMKHGLDPKEWTYANMDRMRAQLRTMGASFDWSKEVVTCSPEYYKWTQWLFTKFYEHGLVERKEAAVKWCPNDQTVLANEQVVDGKCERCGHEVEEKILTQWFMKITQYAERLLSDLEPLPWREEIKEAQRAWIGKSEGAKLRFALKGTDDSIEVFTTRPDTLFGVTYLVLAPEHPLIPKLLFTNSDDVFAYIEQTKKKTERERSENKEKSGVVLRDIYAINPVNGEEIPVYVADYVLGSYGTGAVMAVPAHDERDNVFAKKYQLPIRAVIDPVTGSPQENPTHKQKIVAVVEDGDSILTINWGSALGGRLLIGGGINAGEEIAPAAMREIAEETGYTDLELIDQSQEQVHHEYFAHSKNKATIAHTTLLHFKLRSQARNEQKLEDDEKDKFTVEWISKAQAAKEVTDPLHRYAYDKFVVGLSYGGNGLLRNSGAFDGRDNQEAMGDIVEAAGGENTTNYRLRDWLVSRQRYWGCPIPVAYDPEGNPHAIPEEHLPWLLPTDVDFTPNGQAPLSTSKELKERVTKIFGEGWTPEFDTLDTFVDSSWYYNRYLDSKDEHNFSDPALMKTWLPVDRYAGGAEHTTMHLLYSRFFHKALYDLALVPTAEPFNERYNRGLILGPDGAKMSKSKGNVINPDEVVQKHGADAVRTYLAFIGPYNEPGNYPWNLDGVEAMRRFLDRIAALEERVEDGEVSTELARAVMKAAKKVAEDSERFKLNTAVSAIMVVLKDFEALDSIPRAAYHDLLVLVAPFAPHLAEHLFAATGGEGSVHQASWPTIDSEILKDELVTISIQLNGKRKGEVQAAPDASEEEVLALAKTLNGVDAALSEGEKPARIIYISGRTLNIVSK